MAGKSRADRLAELEAQRKAIEAEPDDEDEYEYEIGWKPEGGADKYARVSSRSPAGRKIAAFFEGSGIDLSDLVPSAGEDEGENEGEGKPRPKGKPAAKQDEGNVRAFRGGRRIS